MRLLRRDAESEAATGRALSRTRRSWFGRVGDLLRGNGITPELWDSLEEVLIGSDAGVETTFEVLDRVRAANPREPGELRDALRRELIAILKAPAGAGRLWAGDADEPPRPAVVLIAGVNGTGKTTAAARLAHEAARVSHDGDAVHAAMLWAAMEAEAFRINNIDRLLDTGLSVIPAECRITRLVEDVRTWHRQGTDWTDTRRQIAENYGYDRYPGNCHVIPNHALMIMAVLHAPNDFHRAQMIVNTSGWDTDCNAGNVGCLQGIMLGLDGLNGGPDWRGPIADRMLISSADGGFAINDAVRVAHCIAGFGHALAGSLSAPAPKDGAQFHFSLPGATQGFQIAEGSDPDAGACAAGSVHDEEHMLGITFDTLCAGRTVVATTPTFATPDVPRMRTYELMATPRLYPGQLLSASVFTAGQNSGRVEVCLRLRHYGEADTLVDIDGPSVRLGAGQEGELSWTVPECASQPIAEIGLAIKAIDREVRGQVFLDRMGWTGEPDLFLRVPEEKCSFWHRAWINAADTFTDTETGGFRISRGHGEGLILHGTREWRDYTLEADVTVHLGQSAGLIARARGLNRYYVARIHAGGRFEILRVVDEDRAVLASTGFAWSLDETTPLSITVRGARIAAHAGDTVLEIDDERGSVLSSGGIGLLVVDGAVSSERMRVSPAN